MARPRSLEAAVGHVLGLGLAMGCGGPGGAGTTIDAALGASDAVAADAGPVPEGPRVVGGARPVDVQVPPGLRAGEVYPLVMILHGYGEAGASVQAYLQLADLAATGGAFVVAPDGTVDGDGNRFWNASAACCDFGETGVDDVAYLGGVLDAVRAGWPIDPARIAVVGHSNGGFMSYRLACARADVVTAIAPLAGANVSVSGAGCAPTEPVSVLHVHGTADDVVQYDGGTLDPGLPAYPGAVASTTVWADLDGCGAGFAAPAGDAALDLTSAAGAETTREVASGCPAGVAVERWNIQAGDHGPALTPSYGDAVAAWLATHPRP